MDYNTNLANLAVFPTLDPLSDFDADNAPPPPRRVYRPLAACDIQKHF